MKVMRLYPGDKFVFQDRFTLPAFLDHLKQHNLEREDLFTAVGGLIEGLFSEGDVTILCINPEGVYLAPGNVAIEDNGGFNLGSERPFVLISWPDILEHLGKRDGRPQLLN